MKPPTTPPPLRAMAERKAALEDVRAKVFPAWKVALEAANGNVTVAGEQQNPALTRNQASKLTHRLGLAEYAAGLRIANVGKSKGTPKRLASKKKVS